jgi:hypothetical protein
MSPSSPPVRTCSNNHLIPKLCRFGLSVGYVYISLVGYVEFFYNTWQKGKSNVKLIYFQKIRAKKKLKIKTSQKHSKPA